MNNKKYSGLCRLMALALVLVMAVGMFPVNAIAAQTPQIVVEQGHARPGDTVQLDVLLQNNTGISNALLALNYDDSLELIQAERGDALTYLFFTKPAVYTSPCNFLWDSLAGEDAEDGTLLTLTFKVKENATVGNHARVWINYVKGDISDELDQPVAVALVEGFVEIIDYIPGDVNGDELINGTDVSLLRRYIIGDPVTIHTLAGDVNGDERLNGTDVVLIRRYIAGGYNVEFKTGRAPCDHPGLSCVEAIAPGCLEAGNIAHWYCGSCNRYFADAATDQEIGVADTVIAPLGHTEVVDPAVAPTYNATGLTEGSHCGVCNAPIVEQQPIDKLQANYHAITYMELHGAQSPEPNRYAEHEGLLDLPIPERPGYAFLGWYTATDGGDVVDYIPKGSTEDYILFARWEKETYSIVYFEAPENDNVSSYTVDDRIVLSEPRWSGLMFTHWTDQYGNIVKEIPKGSSGDLELTANWKRLRNIATPGNSKGLLMTYDEESERYYFIYELGIIEHVVLEEVSLGNANLKYNSGATDLTFSLENSVTISDTVADTIASTVSESVSKTSEWEKSHEWGEETSNAHEVSVSASAEFGIGPVTTTIETEYGYTNTATESWGYSNTEGGSVQTGNETSYTSASTVSYMKEINSTVTTSITISKDMPEGYYSYVHAGNVRVFGIVTYDPGENTFYLDTYSVVDNMHEMMLYYRDVNELNDQTSEPLSYDIPRGRILEIVDNSYYIRYDGNGNDGGQMPLTVHSCQETVLLMNNQYTRTGYTFQDWATDDADVYYRDGSQVTGLGAIGEIVTLKARWSQNAYTVNYHANTPANASAAVTGVPESIACLYDEAVTLGAAPSLTGWTFGGWYRDAECTERLGGGGEYFEAANFTAQAQGVVDAYAKWISNDMQVTLDANGGTVNGAATQTVTMSYNNDYGDLPTPTLIDHVFLGWYLGDQKVDSTTRIVTEADHPLVAKWLRTYQVTLYDISYGWWNPDEYELPDYRKRVTDSDGVYDTAGGGFDKAALKAQGYTQYTVTVGFDACEFNDGYIDLWICNSTKGRLANKEFTISNTHDYHWLTFSYTFSIDELDDAGNFFIEYGANGSGNDDWNLGDATITIQAFK